MSILTIRHFHDQNNLRSYGHDGPLKPGQEQLLAATVQRILEELQGRKTARLLYTAKTRRIRETVNLLSKKLGQNGISVISEHETRLEAMDQGDLILPDDYQDGDWFTPLDVAWDAICDEAYIYDNIFYRFGDSLSGKYPPLEKSFSRFGDSLGWSLINKYSLIYDLIHGYRTKEEELLVVVGQSDLPLIIMEMEELKNRPDVSPSNLPCKCWEIYKSGLQEAMYDNNAQGDGNFDIPMGYVAKFNLSDLKLDGFDKIIKTAGLLLAERSCHEKQDSNRLHF